MWYPPSIDTTHDMYRRNRSAKAENRSVYKPPAVIPNFNGSREQRQAWMRKEQERKKHPVFAVTAAMTLADPVPMPRRKRHANSIITQLAHRHAKALQQRLIQGR